AADVQQSPEIAYFTLQLCNALGFRGGALIRFTLTRSALLELVFEFDHAFALLGKLLLQVVPVDPAVLDIAGERRRVLTAAAERSRMQRLLVFGVPGVALLQLCLDLCDPRVSGRKLRGERLELFVAPDQLGATGRKLGTTRSELFSAGGQFVSAGGQLVASG